MRKPVVSFGKDNIKGVKTQDCCPYCGYGPLDSAIGMKVQTPEEAAKDFARLIDPPESIVTPDHYSVCAKCYAVSLFEDAGDGSLRIRKLTADEMAEFQQSEYWPVLENLRRARWRRKRKPS